MKLYEIYPRTTDKILPADVEDLNQPLTIKDAEVSGETKKTMWLEFEGQTLKHKCSKKDVTVLFNQLDVTDSDDFAGKEIELEVDEDKVSVKEKTKKKEK